MKKKLVYLFILIAVIIIQTSVMPVILSSNNVGDIVLMAVLVFSILDGFSAFIS
jgi:hypothetical protein